VERITGMDPGGLAWASFRWSAGVLAKPSAIPLILGVPAVALAAQRDAHELAFALFLPLGLATAFIAPFAILRSEVLSSPRGRRWWRPRWPGWGPVATLLVLEVAFWLLGIVLYFSNDSPAWYLLLAVLFVPIERYQAAAEAAVLIFRIGPRQAGATLGAAMRWRFLGPVLAHQARLLPIAVAALALFAFFQYIGLTIVPDHAQDYASRGADLPAVIRFAIDFFTYLGRHGGWILWGPLVVADSLIVGRLVWLMSASGRETSTRSAPEAAIGAASKET
jgi:hypothetical protein